MVATPAHPDSDLLAPLGFSELEARIYCFLLAEAPATGYRISHAIGKPTANTYKALAVLARKGAVAVTDGPNRRYAAVPPEELLDRLQRDYRLQAGRALDYLKGLGPQPSDERVFRLEAPEQVEARARAMLGRAQAIVLLDVFPAPFQAIRTDLEAAIRRGVRVGLQVYEPVQVAAALCLESEVGPDLLARWPGQQLSLVVDAREHLLALFSRDGRRLHQAIFSRSRFLSCMQHNHVANELRLRAHQDPDPDLHARAASLSLLNAQPPGLQEMAAACGDRP